ncbi:MAG: flagellar basal body protein [Caulobacterales bacterium]|nr:flagellar basal body protein [Caulobacterales bacterium]
MALVARDPDDRVEQLQTLTKRLAELVARETELFIARRPLEAAPFRDEKAKLANIYRQETARIAKDPALVASADSEARARLAEETERLHIALDEHGRALATLQELTEGLVRAIADHVVETRQATSGYGPAAVARTSDAAASAITLDRSA